VKKDIDLFVPVSRIKVYSFSFRDGLVKDIAFFTTVVVSFHRDDGRGINIKSSLA
jgi:hypothetical protein